MSQYCIYLRKSRMDFEAEARGEGETLSRHRTALLELSKKQKLSVTQIYEEVVSGESIAARPVMQQLLSEVEQGKWSGVLVMEVERLARGDTMDQGLMAQTFKYSDTKIITPVKTYDPNNEFDEEYFEFGLFMSRREYKTINRRLQRGREASVKEGKFVGSIAPYGYERMKIPNDKGFTLKVVPENAEIVKLIFSLYVNGTVDDFGEKRRLGIQQIARKLNQMGIPPIRHDYWQKETIRDMLINPVYIGKVRWKWRPAKKKSVDGKTQVQRGRNYDEDCIIADGLHEAIIDGETFEKAQEYIQSCPPAPVGYKDTIKNPLAGLIICAKCGRKMTFRKATTPNKPGYLVCHARSCNNVGTPIHYVEKRVLDTLRQWIEEYRVEWQAHKQAVTNSDTLRKSLKRAENEIATIEKQIDTTHDLLEQGIYSVEQFLERTKILSEKIETARQNQKNISNELGFTIELDQSRKEFIPKVENLLKVYNDLSSATQKNELLKQVLERSIYLKEKSGAFKGVSPDDFSLTSYPRIPHNHE